MKFGKQLVLKQSEEWRESYIHYKQLVHLLKDLARLVTPEGKAPEYAEAEKQFIAAIEAEVVRVNAAYLVHEEQVNQELKTLREKYREKKSALTPDSLSVLRNDVLVCSQSIFYLQEFGGLNATGFQKLIKKTEKLLGKANVPWAKGLKAVYSTKDFYLSKKPAKFNQIATKIQQANELADKSAEPQIKSALNQTELHVGEDLDLTALPRGSITRLWVTLVQDSMARPIEIPVMVACGAFTGPVVGITAAVHGNELNGIPLIHRLFHEIDCGTLCGTLVAIPVVNTLGYINNSRGFSDGADLNRVFPGSGAPNCSKIFANRFLHNIVKKFEYLIDLHTASFGRVNSFYVRADMNDPMTRRMAFLQHPQIIVHNTGPDGSLRGAAAQLGINAITVEIGNPHTFQLRYIKSALIGVDNILGFLNMISHDEPEREYEPAICSSSYWLFTDVGGLLEVRPEINTWVRKDQLIAVVKNIFGDIVKKYYAPEDGIVIGKNVNPVNQTGDRILHLGVAGSEFSKRQNDGH